MLYENANIDIALVCANGSGDVYGFFERTSNFVSTVPGDSPTFNCITLNTANGWNQGRYINGILTSGSGGGSMNSSFPSYPIALFIHKNPNGTFMEH